MRIGQCLLVSSLLLAPRAAAHGDQNWNQFRGPQTNGHTPSKNLPLRWSEDHNVVWKTAIDGKAWSSPVVWGDAIWMTNATADGKRLSVICIDGRSGRIRHDLPVFEILKPMFCIGYNSYASPTPVIEQGRLWVHYGSAGTACIDTQSGRVIWKRQDLPCDHVRGPGSSPIVFRNLLIVNFDGGDHQYVVALNKHDGKTVWKTNRDIDYKTDNGDAKKAYCTPVVIQHAGRWQLISPAAVATIAYDPLTGAELWKVYHGGFNAAARPLYSHGHVFINLEGGLRLLSVRPDGRGDVTASHIQWTCKKSTPTRPSQLIIGDHMYMVNDKGIVSCLDIHTGNAIWTHRSGGRHSASPICTGDRIYLFGEDGVMRVVRANPERFELLASNRLAAGCMASPAVLDRSLIIRTKTHVYRIGTAAGDAR